MTCIFIEAVSIRGSLTLSRIRLASVLLRNGQQLDWAAVMGNLRKHHSKDKSDITALITCKKEKKRKAMANISASEGLFLSC